MSEFIWMVRTNARHTAVNAAPFCKVFSTRESAKAWVDDVMLPKFAEGDSDYPSASDGHWEADHYISTDLLWSGVSPKSGDQYLIFINRQQIDSQAFYSEGFVSETDAPFTGDTK